MKKTLIINDIKPFEHDQEGTHYACAKMANKYGTKVECCGCTKHDCDPAFEPFPQKTTTSEFDEKLIEFYENANLQTVPPYVLRERLKHAIFELVEECMKNFDPFDLVQECNEDCTPEEHAYHQGTWDSYLKAEKELKEIRQRFKEALGS